MSDLISRERALADLDGHEYSTECEFENDEAWARGYNAAIAHVKNHLIYQPSVEPVRGEWVHIGGDEWCCSNCGYVISTEGSWEKPERKFCEECGADMRKKVE